MNTVALQIINTDTFQGLGDLTEEFSHHYSVKHAARNSRLMSRGLLIVL